MAKANDERLNKDREADRGIARPKKTKNKSLDAGICSVVKQIQSRNEMDKSRDGHAG